jgi:hypothetical protein
MEKRRGNQKGPQKHAEGQHGKKSHARFIKQLHEPMHRDETSEHGDSDTKQSTTRGDRQRR